MQVIDSHVHVWDPAVLDYAWLADAPVLNRAFLPADLPHTAGNTRAAVFVQADCRDDQALKEVDWVSGLGRSWPQLAGIVAFAPISRGDAVSQDLGQLLERPLVRGVRQLFQDRDASFLLAPATLAGARQVAMAGLVFDACVRAGQLAILAEFADRTPELMIVLDHMAKPPIASGEVTAWSSGMRELARRPNVVVKISGAGAEADRNRPLAPQAAPYIQETLHLFGADRCMIGSDCPVSLTTPAAYQDWIATVEQAMTGASDGERRAVAHGTAARIYRLQVTPGQTATNQETD
ncbi:amidohydrolase family protein [Arthrobacter sp. ISL-85]|uniref:amidohydrolase family protein n=1 Tax=Arthrobacter sp. ISL-85 TaxID=2819115 RepID=UPI001BE978A7|nr:amidohydrolase family protein [Arthrobacter sp. ISL-85]MBT2566166.1 amidohydrolase family protein [Arthrobacter sp. ISL-85]